MRHQVADKQLQGVQSINFLLLPITCLNKASNHEHRYSLITQHITKVQPLV